MDLKIAVVDPYIMAATLSWLMTTMLQKVKVDDVSTYESFFFVCLFVCLWEWSTFESKLACLDLEGNWQFENCSHAG